MVRTVKVRLELDREDYKAGLHDAAAETRAFDAEVKGAGDSAQRTGVEMKDAGDAARKLGDDAKTSARDTEAMGTSTRKLGEETKRTSQSTYQFSEATKRAGDGLEQLKAHLKETESQYEGLRQLFVSTGNVSILGDIQKAQRDAQQIKNLINSTFGDIGDEAKTSAKDVDAAASSTRKFGDDVRASGDKVEAAKGRLTELQAALRNVDLELARTKATIAELTSEFARTGDTDLIGKITGQKNSASTLSKFRKDLETAKDEAEKAFSFGTSNNSGLLNFALDEWVKNLALKTGQGIQEGLASLGDSIAQHPIIATIVGAAALAAVPLISIIGSAIGAGVTVGFGGGVLAIGIKQAISDPGVRSAWSEMGRDAKAALSQGSSSFVQPLIDAAGKVQAAFDSILPHIQSAFQAIGPTLDNIGTGAAGFIQQLGPALDKLASFSAPFLKDLGDWLPELGQHLSGFIDSLTSAGPGLRMFFNDLLDFINSVIDALGSFINISSRVYSVLEGLLSLFTGDFSGAVQGFAGAMGSAGDAAQHVSINVQALMQSANGAASATQQIGLRAQLAAGEFQKLSSQIGQTAQTSDVLAGAMSDKLLNSMLSLDQADLAFHQSLTSVEQALGQNGRQLDINTAKGQANRSAVLQAVAANIRQYDALISAGVGAQDAAAAYDANTGALERQLRKAGLTQSAIDGLIGKYRQVPDQVNTDIILHGLTDAINNLNTTLRLINGLPAYKQVDINVVTTQSVIQRVTRQIDSNSPLLNSRAHGGIDYMAAGGAIVRSPTILFGERQTEAEAYIPKRGIPDSRGLALANTAASWHGGHVVRNGPRGGGAVTVNSTLTVGGGTGLMPAELLLANWFHNAILHGQITLKADDAGLVRVA